MPPGPEDLSHAAYRKIMDGRGSRSTQTYHDNGGKPFYEEKDACRQDARPPAHDGRPQVALLEATRVTPSPHPTVNTSVSIASASGENVLNVLCAAAENAS